MLNETKLKTVVKSMPLLYSVLFPAIAIFHWLRRRAWANEMDRFRQYCRHLSEVVSEPVVVKVGANDGVTGDPCSDILLAKTNWRGVLIEPVPYCFDRLKATFQNLRRFSLEQVAIGATAGEAPFYYVDAKAIESMPDLPKTFDQLGSFDRNHIVKCFDGALVPFIIECTVQVHPLSDIIRRNGIQAVHLLHVDAEGHDYEVLKTIDFSERTPLSIFVEHRHLSDVKKSEMLGLLRRHGYSVRDCGRDYFAVNEEANARLPRIVRPSHGNQFRTWVRSCCRKSR